MTAFLRSARTTSGVGPTGDVLHLSTWRGTFVVPICDTYARAWAATGPGMSGWERHAHWPVCTRCQRALRRLQDELAEQQQRVVEHDDTPMRTARRVVLDNRTDPLPADVEPGTVVVVECARCGSSLHDTREHDDHPDAHH